jgi:hypothetical protein
MAVTIVHIQNNVKLRCTKCDAPNSAAASISRLHSNAFAVVSTYASRWPDADARIATMARRATSAAVAAVSPGRRHARPPRPSDGPAQARWRRAIRDRAHGDRTEGRAVTAGHDREWQVHPLDRTIDCALVDRLITGTAAGQQIAQIPRSYSASRTRFVGRFRGQGVVDGNTRQHESAWRRFRIATRVTAPLAMSPRERCWKAARRTARRGRSRD